MFAAIGFVLVMAPALAAAQAQGALPWKPADPAPAIAGIHLRESREQVEAALGGPDEAKNVAGGATTLTWRSRGIAVVFAPKVGAAIISYLTRQAGDIGGVAIGDTKQSVQDRWGVGTINTSNGWVYRMDTWVVALSFDPITNVVNQLGIGVPNR